MTSNPLSVSRVLAMLRARLVTALVMFLLVVGLAAALTALMPRSYSPVAQVVIDVKPIDPVSGLSVAAQAASTYASTQADILQSERVAIDAVRALKLAENPDLVREWQESDPGASTLETWLAGSLLKKLKVVPSKDSNVLTVTWSSSDPVRATAVTNAIVKSYLNVARELRVTPAQEFGRMFDDQARQLHDALAQARARLATYERENGLIATADSIDLETRQLSELTNRLVEVRVAADQSSSRQAAAAGRGDRSTEVLDSRIIDQLTVDLTRESSELNRRLQTLGPGHPDLTAQKTVVADLRRKLDSETRRIASSVDLKDKVDQARLDRLLAEVERQRAKVLAMRDQRDKAAGLLHDVENAQKAYDTVYARASQASLEGQAGHSNISLLHEALVPASPSSPKVLRNMLAATGLGLLLALAVALGREMRDARLRHPRDVVEQLGLPLIGVIGDRNSSSSRSTGMRERMLQEPRPMNMPSLPAPGQ